MAQANEQTREALIRLQDEISSRLFRESEDYRVLLALQQAIGWLDKSGRTTAPTPRPVTETTDAAGRTISAIDMLANLAREVQPMAGRRPEPRMMIAPESGAVSQRDVVAMILRERGEPVPISELLELMQIRGVVVGGVRPQGNLSSNLSQDKRFRPVRYRDRACWWLVDEPVPPPAVRGPEVG
ncbi:hypothetical protein [uncultured Alsobacter sp.]|uniref:hypothetical protein n=1 Tax=uncultured Alsobacter sp. TaxID=1748258 RepID=UPI0025D7136E|nr:hypothetical protein [uncultured Alsobacter sp.]